MLSNILFQNYLKIKVIIITSIKGIKYVSKIDGMINDLKGSQMLKNKFDGDKLSKGLKIDFSAHMLTTSYWPSYSISSVELPEELKTLKSTYAKFYEQDYPDRQLSWQTSLGGGIVKGKFPLGNKDIMASTYQMTILMILNKGPTTFKDLLTQTKIVEKELKRNLTQMYAGKYKIIEKSPNNESLEIDQNDKFFHNINFKSSNERIKISMSSVKKDEKKDKNEDEEDDKKNTTIDNIIIKIMKQRKDANITNLQGEVLVSLKKLQINPQSGEIQKRIEFLIENNTLSKNLNDSKQIVFNN
jgi:cullin 3